MKSIRKLSVFMLIADQNQRAPQTGHRMAKQAKAKADMEQMDTQNGNIA